MPGVWEVTPFSTLTVGTIVNSSRTDRQTYSAAEKHETEGKSGFSRVLARVQNLTFKITRIPTQHYSLSQWLIIVHQVSILRRVSDILIIIKIIYS